MKVYVVTMGCPKNLVDSEAAVTVLKRAGCDLTADPAEAGLLMVGACSFLESSWRETVDEVRRLAGHKREGNRLVLMGCLPRHRNEDLGETLPWVDHFLPTGAHGLLPGLLRSWEKKRNGEPRMLDGSRVDRFMGFEDRELLTPPHTAYVKIAEGCDRRCSFCAIPAIRGRQIVRPVRSVVAEVARMVERGVREVTLLAQDVASYRDNGRDFLDLVDGIVETGIQWIRVLYVHPAGLRIEHVERMFAHPSVVRYVELPIQHVSTRLLKRMRRSHGRAHLESLLAGIRSKFADAVIRSEVIVGFPGETDDDFEELKEFVEEFEFESLGVFPYSREPGTEAASYDDAVPAPIIRHRVEELVSAQEAVSFGVCSRRVGDVYAVLVDREIGADERVFAGCGFAGRFYGQAPEVDGEVYLQADGLRVGDFVDARITETGVFDLKGELVK
jgi:ribosomal protein S12 methylthiotransferase